MIDLYELGLQLVSIMNNTQSVTPESVKVTKDRIEMNISPDVEIQSLEHEQNVKLLEYNDNLYGNTTLINKPTPITNRKHIRIFRKQMWFSKKHKHNETNTKYMSFSMLKVMYDYLKENTDTEFHREFMSFVNKSKHSFSNTQKNFEDLTKKDFNCYLRAFSNSKYIKNNNHVFKTKDNQIYVYSQYNTYVHI